MEKTLTVFFYTRSTVSPASFEETLYSLLCIRAFSRVEIELLGSQKYFPAGFEEIIQKFSPMEWGGEVIVRNLAKHDDSLNIFSELNEGIKRSNSDFFGIVSANEVVFQDCYAKLAELLTEHDEGVAIGRTREAYFAKDESCLFPVCETKSPLLPHVFIAPLLLLQKPYTLSNLLIRRSKATESILAFDGSKPTLAVHRFYADLLGGAGVVCSHDELIVSERRVVFSKANFDLEKARYLDDSSKYFGNRSQVDELAERKRISFCAKDLEPIFQAYNRQKWQLREPEVKFAVSFVEFIKRFAWLRPSIILFLNFIDWIVSNLLFPLLEFRRVLRGLPRSLFALSFLMMDFFRVKQATSIPIFINNRNRLDTLLELVGFLERAGCKNIFIIDNDSDYPPLLEFYQATCHKIIILKKNAGPLALWNTEARNFLRRGFYIYTDSDVVPDFSADPRFLRKLLLGFVLHPTSQKVGLGLKIDDLPVSFRLRDNVIKHERKYWSFPRNGGFYLAPIDTTFAMYAPGEEGGYWLRGLRTAPPYVAKHLPWYVDDQNLSSNEKYYRQTASHYGSWAIR